MSFRDGLKLCPARRSATRLVLADRSSGATGEYCTSKSFDRRPGLPTLNLIGATWRFGARRAGCWNSTPDGIDPRLGVDLMGWLPRFRMYPGEIEQLRHQHTSGCALAVSGPGGSG